EIHPGAAAADQVIAGAPRLDVHPRPLAAPHVAGATGVGDRGGDAVPPGGGVGRVERVAERGRPVSVFDLEYAPAVGVVSQVRAGGVAQDGLQAVVHVPHLRIGDALAAADFHTLGHVAVA